MKTVSNNPQLQVDLILQDHNMTLEVGTEAGDNFLSIDKWRKLGSPALSTSQVYYKSATKDKINMLGVCFVNTKQYSQQHKKKLLFVVSNIPNLNPLGKEGIRQLNISVDGLMHGQTTQRIQQLKPNGNLLVACQKLYRRTPLSYGYFTK